MDLFTKHQRETTEFNMGGDRIVLPNGLVMWLPSVRMRGAANYLVREIFQQQRYAHQGFEIGRNDIVVDIGANMGVFVLWAAPQTPQGKVLAVEPTGAIDSLETNVSINQLDNVISLKAAVGVDGRESRFTTYPGFNIINHKDEWTPAAVTRFLIRLRYGRGSRMSLTETVPTFSLGTLMDRYGLDRIDLLKVDCEGGEYEIFECLESYHFQRIRRIAMEFHEYQPAHDHRRLVQILKAHGFKTEVHKPWLVYRFMKYGSLWAWQEHEAAR
jgi:FkbM family methyltransferase